MDADELDEHSPRLTQPVGEGDHVLGSGDAPVTLLEYGDYECPFCRDAHFAVKRLRKAAARKVLYVYRHFPLTEMHPNAFMAAEAAEAAGMQGKFWEMHELLFENQDQLDADAVIEWAQLLGLDLEAFQDAIESGETAARIKEDRSSGIRSGVNGTPTFFVNGVRYNGAPRYEELAEVARGAAKGKR